MSRALIRYDDRSAPAAPVAGFDPDVPVAGFYRMRLVSGGIEVGLRIWNGPPLDPVTGEELDRSWRWQATANGDPLDLARAWPKCAGAPITEAEHDHLASLQTWGTQHGHAALADPRRRLDPLHTPLMF